MMYSLPIAFEASSLQSRIFGIGMLVLVCTKTYIMVSYYSMLQSGYINLNSRYLIVATSELVVNLGGPASAKGSLATTRFALSVVKIKTLLKPPSFLS
jgi:hypothetical protein